MKIRLASIIMRLLESCFEVSDCLCLGGWVSASCMQTGGMLISYYIPAVFYQTLTDHVLSHSSSRFGQARVKLNTTETVSKPLTLFYPPHAAIMGIQDLLGFFKKVRGHDFYLGVYRCLYRAVNMTHPRSSEHS